MDKTEKALLITRAKQGDTEAFGQVYEVYARDVFNYLNTSVTDRKDAEDLTEETFLRVWRSLPNMPVTDFDSYLMTVARNVILDNSKMG